MPDSDTTLEHHEEAGELIREEPVDVTAEVIHVDDTDAVEVRPTRSIVLRQVLARQLVAGQDLSAQLVDAATDASVAVAHAPATVVDEIRSGATLPTALANTGSSVRGVVTDAGSRVRSAVGTARERIGESVSRARQEIRAAVKDFDDLAEAFSDDD